jgi:hypothetical protein
LIWNRIGVLELVVTINSHEFFTIFKVRSETDNVGLWLLFHDSSFNSFSRTWKCCVFFSSIVCYTLLQFFLYSNFLHTSRSFYRSLFIFKPHFFPSSVFNSGCWSLNISFRFIKFLYICFMFLSTSKCNDINE